MYESEIEKLQEEIATFEKSLNDVLLAEYYKRRRFVDVLLEDFLKNSDEVDELQGNRNDNYGKLDKILNEFRLVSLVLFCIGIATHAYSYLLLIFYIFIASIFARVYFDTRSNDQMQLGNLVLCQMEIQRIKRELQKYGISEGEAISFKVYNRESRKNNENGDVNDKDNQPYWIQLRITQQICEGFKFLVY